jgi:hypothetical protein
MCCSADRDRFERETHAHAGALVPAPGCDWFASRDRTAALPFAHGAKGRSTHSRGLGSSLRFGELLFSNRRGRRTPSRIVDMAGGARDPPKREQPRQRMPGSGSCSESRHTLSRRSSPRRTTFSLAIYYATDHDSGGVSSSLTGIT